MSNRWNVEKGKSGQPDIISQRHNIPSVGMLHPIAELKKEGKIIANYWGLDNVKDDDIKQHAKSYCEEHGEIVLIILNSNKSYRIRDKESKQ